MRNMICLLAIVNAIVAGSAALVSAAEQPDIIAGVHYCSTPQTGNEGTKRALARAACDLAVEAAGYEHGVLRPCAQDEPECATFQCDAAVEGFEPRQYICYGVGR